ncbi:hypothetical protein HDU85_002225 [Gaertneriomyces sp. JEL0708]|nr:hypothetical protein HDU85_002225 [Gaertneriomyces sp. JEL0708]
MVALTVLTNKEEEIVLNDLKKNARSKCKDLLEALVACTRSRTVTVYWACQAENKAVNECLGRFTTNAEYDKLRTKFLEDKKQWRSEQKRKEADA